MCRSMRLYHNRPMLTGKLCHHMHLTAVIVVNGSPPPIQMQHTWIGIQGNGTHFVWTADGTTVEGSSWSSGYPVQSYGKTCVFQNRNNAWKNVDCEAKAASAFVCEIVL